MELYNETAPRLQKLLGKYIRARVTQPMGAPCEGQNRFGINYGEVVGFPPVGGKPDGVFILGIHHPVRYFDGRVIALAHCGDGRVYAVTAPRNHRYIQGQIHQALCFFFSPESNWQLQCLYEHSCGAVVFRRAEDGLRFLLIKNCRSANWGYPKGHVENGETPEQTACREVLEETALHIRLLPGFSCHSEYVIQGNIEKSVTVFLAEALDRRIVLQEAEIEDYLWLSAQKAQQVLKFENDRMILRKACAYLRRAGIS